MVLLDVIILIFQFQSTPDLVNRENLQQQLQSRATLLFQSTPDLVNRENNLAQI